MIKINLLPAEIAAEQRRKSRQKWCSLAVLLLAALLLGIFGKLDCLAQQTAAEIAGIQKQRAFVERDIEQYEPLSELQKSLDVKKNLLTIAMGAEFGWRETLAELGGQIPASVRLTNLELVFDGASGTLTLHGLADSHSAAADWAGVLEAVPNISGVRINFSSLEQGADGELVRFKLEAEVFTGELPQPAGRSEE
ncbi:MAG: PilN domain-containing protein [Firmicutes bacterium]|nr:PilN domain-containing protein [Bacillota bacterium]